MAGGTLDQLLNEFDEHPSLQASLEDFEHDERSPIFGIPSHHSGFRSEDSDAGSESNRPWSPPAWRQAASGWYRHSGIMSASPSRSAGTSPRYESAQEYDYDVTFPANIPLPRSPSKGPTPSATPEYVQQYAPTTPMSPMSPVTPVTPMTPMFDDVTDDEPTPTKARANNNYIRFAVRAEVQHRTEPIEDAISYFRRKYNYATRSRSATIFSILMAILSFTTLRLLFQTPQTGLVPDLVRVAGLARSFEPLIAYSETGVQQIGGLQETGVAVWDLGESVRATNMTSATIIVKELDELSDNLRVLAEELTKFFANVDGDVDGILIVMEWTMRELGHVSSIPTSTLSPFFDNMHTILCRVGILENSKGQPTALGKVVSDLFGQSNPQRTKATLERTFGQFLTVLEEAIQNELTYSTALFALFESIDRQFLNLQRSVIRETDTQERMEGELLSSLWTRVVGVNASRLRKYERNRNLLATVRAKTVHNKHILVDHNQKLLALKSNLEILRKKLVSPLIRGSVSGEHGGSSLSVEEQIKGLEGTYEGLKRSRERQKQRLFDMVHVAGMKRVGITRDGGEVGEIEGS